MVFDTRVYHDHSVSQDLCFASDTLLKRISWQHSANGLVVVDREDQTPFTGFIARRVSPFNLKCGTGGNYLKRGGLEKAKYHLHLIRPTDKALGRDFDVAISNLDKMQEAAGKCSDHRNMIKIRIPDSPHSQRHPNAPLMDDITEKWPILSELEEEFDGIKYTHRAVPLPVFQTEIQ
ncbi:hypothetical protein BDR07DRAFT_1612310 [Suillus spraguei]|nr:hypothetical protein BDR07DRAFT_1612310 [Suillus spraguei]